MQGNQVDYYQIYIFIVVLAQEVFVTTDRKIGIKSSIRKNNVRAKDRSLMHYINSKNLLFGLRLYTICIYSSFSADFVVADAEL